MDVPLRYRGREVTDADIAFIRELIATHPGASRRALSKMLCEAWDWRQPNGQLRDMVCRGLMLELDRAGFIELPPVRQVPPNNVVVHRRRPAVAVDPTPLCARLEQIRPVEIRQVRRKAEEPLFDSLIEEHHYLGYTRPVGEHLKYLIRTHDRPIACMAWSSAPRHLGPRDRFIGWSPEARRRNIRYLAYNTRFLILPWVQVPHLASHLLGRVARVLSADWDRLYGHPIYYLETFVDPARFRGTCYRAANWIGLGLTTGRGKDAPTMKPTRPKKEVLGYPLTKDFRELLSGGE
ncbi:MAG: DUF4338 domain-containing protein [Gemmatimonadota bacterium]|nr:MAG: DUF4338 domain-containing protein [Gemmatimonadota bacterium]